MDTVLNVGINDQIVELIVQRSDGYVRFAYDLYRRFLQMFGHVVMKVDKVEYQTLLEEALSRDGVHSDEFLSKESLKFLVEEYKKLAPIPQDPYVQLQMTIEAIFCSWNTKRFDKFLPCFCFIILLSLRTVAPRDSAKECIFLRILELR